MIVRELIAALGKLPPDLDVRVWDHKEDDWADVVVAWKESGSPYVDLMTFDPATQGDPKAMQMPTSPLDAFAKSTGLTRVEVAQARLGDIDASGVLHVPDCACRLRIESGHFAGCPYAAAEQASPMPGEALPDEPVPMAYSASLDQAAWHFLTEDLTENDDEGNAKKLETMLDAVWREGRDHERLKTSGGTEDDKARGGGPGRVRENPAALASHSPAGGPGEAGTIPRHALDRAIGLARAIAVFAKNGTELSGCAIELRDLLVEHDRAAPSSSATPPPEASAFVHATERRIIELMQKHGIPIRWGYPTDERPFITRDLHEFAAAVYVETIEACAKVIDDAIDADRATLANAFAPQRRRDADRIRALSTPFTSPAPEKKT